MRALRRPALAARVFCTLALLVVGFQLALIVGAPWGRLTMGGTFPSQLPPEARVAAGASALVLLLSGAVVAARAGLALPSWRATSRKLVWVVVALMALGAVLNAITPSPWERVLWLPVTLVQLACVVVVARGE